MHLSAKVCFVGFLQMFYQNGHKVYVRMSIVHSALASGQDRCGALARNTAWIGYLSIPGFHACSDSYQGVI